MHVNQDWILIIFFCTGLFLSCQGNNPGTENEQTRIEDSISSYKKDSIVLFASKPFYNEDCGRKLGKEVEKRIKTIISEERYKSVTDQNTIRYYIEYTFEGKIIEVNFQQKGFTKEEFNLMKQAIMSEKLDFVCHGYNVHEVKEMVSKEDVIIWRLLLPYNPEVR